MRKGGRYGMEQSSKFKANRKIGNILVLKIWMCFLIHLSSLQCSEESTNLPWMWIWLNKPVNLVGRIIFD